MRDGIKMLRWWRWVGIGLLVLLLLVKDINGVL
jgi:hypothetical protein